MSQRKRVRLEQEVIRAAREVNALYPVVSGVQYDLRAALLDLDTHLNEITNSPGYTGPNSPQTSHDAAGALIAVSGELRHAIVDTLWLDSRNWDDREHEGMTCEQVEVRLGRPHHSVSSAMYYLRHSGWIFDSGRVRSTHAGRDAIVWRLTPAAHERMLNPT